MVWDQSLVIYAIGMGLFGVVVSLLVQLLTRWLAALLLAGLIVSAVVALGVVNVPEEILRTWGHAVGQVLGSLMPLLKGQGEALRGFFAGLLRDQPQVGGSAFALGLLAGLVLRHLRQ